MIKKLNEDNSWLLENESYLKNRKRRRITGLIICTVFAVIGLLIFFYYKETDKRICINLLDGYYEILNERKTDEWTANYEEYNDDARNYLKENGYNNPKEWFAAVQDIELQKLSEKYGSNFKVIYRLEKIRKMTDDELIDYQKSSPQATRFDKGYKLSVREHFKGSKNESYETSEIWAVHDEADSWSMHLPRWIDIYEEIK